MQNYNPFMYLNYIFTKKNGGETQGNEQNNGQNNEKNEQNNKKKNEKKNEKNDKNKQDNGQNNEKNNNIMQMSFNNLPENTNEKNAIIYCRLSKQKNNIDVNNINGTSLESQQEECLKFCRNNNLKVREIICEICSAYKINKNGSKQKKLMEILNLITSNDILIVWEISRFSRNIINGTRGMEIIRSRNAGIYIVNSRCGYPMTCEYYDIINKIIYAQQESDIISERIKRSIKTKRENGSYIGSIPPYGKKIIKNDDKKYSLDINYTEQFIIEKIIKLYNEGKKNSDISDNLNSNNILRRNKKWTIYSIKRIINDHIINFNMNNMTKTLMEINKISSNKKRKNDNMICDNDESTNKTSKKIKIEKMNCNEKKKKKKYIIIK